MSPDPGMLRGLVLLRDARGSAGDLRRPGWEGGEVASGLMHRSGRRCSLVLLPAPVSCSATCSSSLAGF